MTSTAAAANPATELDSSAQAVPFKLLDGVHLSTCDGPKHSLHASSKPSQKSIECKVHASMAQAYLSGTVVLPLSRISPKSQVALLWVNCDSWNCDKLAEFISVEYTPTEMRAKFKHKLTSIKSSEPLIVWLVLSVCGLHYPELAECKRSQITCGNTLQYQVRSSAQSLGFQVELTRSAQNPSNCSHTTTYNVVEGGHCSSGAARFTTETRCLLCDSYLGSETNDYESNRTR